MIIDLNRIEGKQHQGDVLIVGGGTCGLLLAKWLAERHKSVIVLESGAADATDAANELNRCEYIGKYYPGADRGRARGLGGTSAIWGGALVPYVDGDLLPRPLLGLGGWPIPLDQLRRYEADVREAFGIYEGCHDDLASSITQQHGPILERFALWPTFGNRNVASLTRRDLERGATARVYVNATVTRVNVDKPTGVATGVSVTSWAGNKHEVQAKVIILCAGAIESTRLMLVLDRDLNGELDRRCGVLGRKMHDHVSWDAARIDCSRPTAINKLAAFRFLNTAMSNLRFEMSARAQKEEVTHAAFSHIAFRSKNISPFDRLRKLAQLVQRRGGLSPNLITEVLQIAPYLVKVGYWRAIHRQLYWPRPVEYRLHVVVEQAVVATNSISLSKNVDQFGVPVPRIAWGIGDSETKTLAGFRKCFDAFWRERYAAKIGRLAWEDVSAENLGASATDVYHPGGTTVMGSSGSSSVVDSDLESHHIRNLRILSTSTFPSAGAANPTFTLLILARRLAASLCR